MQLSTVKDVIYMDDGSYISLKMEHINADGTKGECVLASISQEEYDAIYRYLMRDESASTELHKIKKGDT